ncbi:hypothetical protein PTSG_00282 [Salpingoeca rosetta]|uniref:Uncharacterized protein n=1 Tax=Salpingoeca rosetta (strain ATCC 50818 / BSB-021) TaxID=946362 RepID=F2TW16_SALR5|nr:uncharacterized protein PTSG_00282 [Salpingoeca rosetta]EGD72262.1 hypothetical protein PTSG_00282 [Salpingoeca rosetta]|eukprot:XP_004998833.1 hypothetical protein PTSG_00282 [Salpingoeca rosetta]
MDGHTQEQLQQMQQQQPHRPVPGFSNVLDHGEDESQQSQQTQEPQQAQQQDTGSIHKHRRLTTAELQALMALALQHDLPRKKGHHGVRREWTKVANEFQQKHPSQPPLSGKAVQARVSRVVEDVKAADSMESHSGSSLAPYPEVIMEAARTFSERVDEATDAKDEQRRKKSKEDAALVYSSMLPSTGETSGDEDDDVLQAISSRDHDLRQQQIELERKRLELEERRSVRDDERHTQMMAFMQTTMATLGELTKSLRGRDNGRANDDTDDGRGVAGAL